MRSVRAAVVLAVAVAVGGVAMALADTVDLKNPGFETGEFRPWKTFDDGSGEWFVYRKGDKLPEPPAPRRGGGGLERLPKPPQGKRAAFLTQDGPGFHVLHRVLKPRSGAELNKLRFFLFYRNTADRFWSPNHFEFGEAPLRGMDGPPKAPNQQVRVDLMKRRAPLDSLKPNHILATLLRTRANDDLRQPYTKLRANLTNLGIDRKFRLRIAEVDNQSNLFVGVDGLKLKFRP
jgi:hypothetical protein